MTTTSLPNRLNELNAETQYYVLSHSGRRSEIIAEFLRNNGFQATHIIGGVKAFKKAALCQLVLLAIKSMGEKVIFSMTFSPVFIFFFN